MNKDTFSVIIPYNKNAYGLVYTLTMLQNQTIKPDKIIVIDTSSNKSGLTIAKIFSYGEIPLIVEVSPVHIYKAWNKGIELSGPNANTLIINDDLIFPVNFIQIMKYALDKEKALIHVPQTSSREHRAHYIDQKVNAVCQNVIEFKETEWMPGFCYLLTKECIKQVGVFDTEKYDIWFGDTEYEKRAIEFGKRIKVKPINLVKGLFVYHFGGMSYGYTKKKVLEVIKKDRENFLKI